MSRKFFIIILALFYLAVSAIVLADEAEDIQKIKELLHRYEDGVWNGEPEKIISCFDPSFVVYGALDDSVSMFMLRGDHHNIIDPEDWDVLAAGPDIIREHAEAFKGRPDWVAKHPDYKHGMEVRHVNVMDDHAIAVWRIWRSWTDETARETVRTESRTVWMLTRIRGEWKTTSWIFGVSRGQRVSKQGPE